MTGGTGFDAGVLGDDGVTGANGTAGFGAAGGFADLGAVGGFADLGALLGDAAGAAASAAPVCIDDSCFVPGFGAADAVAVGASEDSAPA